MTMLRKLPIEFILFISLFFMSLGAYADPPLPTPVARVVWVKGTLTAVMPNKEERKLQKTSVIYLKDTLMTSADSEAQIVFTDNTLMTFEQNTTFEVSKYNYKPGNKSAGEFVMNLVRGGFRTITGLISKKNPQDYAINTPIATIGVRGTDYRVHIQDGKVYFGQYHGAPCVKNEKAELCLDDKHKYGIANDKDTDPSYLNYIPDFFKRDLTIVNAKISPFGSQGGNSNRVSGNSFCISQ